MPCHRVLTEWDLYRKLDYRRSTKAWSSRPSSLTARNILDHQGCFDLGFNVFPLGKPPLKHF